MISLPSIRSIRSSGITTVASNIYDFDQDVLQKAVWKLCLYKSQENRVYTVDVVSINVCALSTDHRHGGHDNLVCRACPCGSYEDPADVGLCWDGESSHETSNAVADSSGLKTWAKGKVDSCLASFTKVEGCLCNHPEALSRDDPNRAKVRGWSNLERFQLVLGITVNVVWLTISLPIYLIPPLIRFYCQMPRPPMFCRVLLLSLQRQSYTTVPLYAEGSFDKMWEEWYNADWQEVNRGAMGNVRRLEGKESGHAHKGRQHHVEVSVEA